MNHDIWLQVNGAMLEKLTQRALAEGAEFSGIRRIGARSMVFTADLRSVNILMALCRKYGLDCRQLRRGGWTAAMDLFRMRWTVLLGLGLCVLICCLFLNHIWIIDVEFKGKPAVANSSQYIYSTLERMGIRIGMPVQEVNPGLLQKQLTAAAGDFSYIGVRRQGIRLLVEASPEVAVPDVHVLDHARDLVATRDGVVESVNVYSGSACVKPGDTVRQGQVLIRGEEVSGKDAETGEPITIAVRARGEIIARCWYEGSAEAPLTYMHARRTGKTRSCACLKLMRFSLPLSECEAYPLEETEWEILPVVGLFLPLEIERSIHHELRPETLKADPAQLESRLIPLARAAALSAMERDDITCRIVNHWTDASQHETILRVRAVYEIYTDIAATRDVLTEEVY